MNILRNLFLWRVARPLVGKAIDLGLGMSSMDGDLLAACPLGVTLRAVSREIYHFPYDEVRHIAHGPVTERELAERRANRDKRERPNDKPEQPSLDQSEIADLMRRWVKEEPA